jgi:hypothetical protein
MTLESPFSLHELYCHNETRQHPTFLPWLTRPLSAPLPWPGPGFLQIPFMVFLFSLRTLHPLEFPVSAHASPLASRLSCRCSLATRLGCLTGIFCENESPQTRQACPLSSWNSIPVWGWRGQWVSKERRTQDNFRERHARRGKG